MLRIPPITFRGVGLPLLIFDAPLRGENYFLTVDDAYETLLPAMTDDPFDIPEFKRTIRIRLAEIRQHIFVRAIGNDGANHFVVSRILPAFRMTFMTGCTFVRA